MNAKMIEEANRLRHQATQAGDDPILHFRADLALCRAIREHEDARKRRRDVIDTTAEVSP